MACQFQIFEDRENLEENKFLNPQGDGNKKERAKLAPLTNISNENQNEQVRRKH